MPKNEIIDKIKSLEDALENQGVSYNDIIPFKEPKNQHQESCNAWSALSCISKSKT